MSVKAKFKVESVTTSMGNRKGEGKDQWGNDIYEPCKVYSISASPVYGGNDPNHENAQFFNSTPSGRLELNVINEQAVEAFEVGGEVYLTFEKA